MGLLSSMGKVVNFTNKLIGVTNPQFSHANVSVGSWGRILGLGDSLSFNSLSDIRQSISDIKGAISQTVTTAACLKYMLWDNPAEMLNFLDQLATGVMGAIGSVVDQIIDAISFQISNAVSQVVGAIVSLVGALQSLWESILLLTEIIIDTVKSWGEWGELSLELDLQKENCKDMFASIAGCYLNKFLGSYLDEFAEKAVNQINTIGTEFNNILYDELQDVNTFSSYARQESFLLKKAAIQIKGLSKENILGNM